MLAGMLAGLLHGCLVAPDPLLWQRARDAASGPDSDAAGLDGATAHEGGSSGDSGGAGCSWSGKLTFAAPKPLTALNSSASDLEPYLSPDGLTIYFASGRDGSMDVFRATRASTSADFSGVKKHLEVSTATDAETRFALARSGLEAFLATDRAGGDGGSDIWVATRSSTATPFTPGMFKHVADLNSSSQEWDPYPAASGLRLYYCIHDWPGGKGGTEIVVATRASPTAPFSTPAAVPGVNSSADDDNPAVTKDELVLVFGSKRPGGKGETDIWYAVRSDPGAAFSTPKPIPALNTAYRDSEVYVTPDGCELYFASQRPGGKGKHDLYYTRLLP